ncbi:MAG: ArsR family transcriptional regulator [Promethearchaeota archaeon]|nr:MAG: ArsR family transcriptional regulator [Candidatus Lokiarchaeota archaeon]
MSEQKENVIDMDWRPEIVQDIILITDPEMARILLHDDKKRILTLLIQQDEMTIQELTNATGINPGTIKRHIDDLIRNKLAFKSNQKRSEYNVKMKYYSAVAKKFAIDIHIPDNEMEN